MSEDALIIENLLYNAITVHYRVANGRHSLIVPPRGKVLVEGIGYDNLGMDTKLVHIPRKHLKASRYGASLNPPKYDINYMWAGALCEAVENLSGNFIRVTPGTHYTLSSAIDAVHALSAHIRTSFVITRIVTPNAVLTSHDHVATSIHGSIVATAHVTETAEKATHSITGTVTGHATVSGHLTLALGLSKTVTGHATLSDSLPDTYKVQGTALGHHALSAGFITHAIVVGTVTGHAVLSDTVYAQHTLTGTITGHAVLSDSLHAQHKLTSTVTGHAVLSDSLHAQHTLSSTVTGHATLSDTIHAQRILSKTITGHAVLSKNFIDALVISKTVVGTAAVTATGITVVVAPHATLGLFMLGSATLGTV